MRLTPEQLVSLIISNTASQYSEEWKPDKVYSKDELIEIATTSTTSPSKEEIKEEAERRFKPPYRFDSGAKKNELLWIEACEWAISNNRQRGEVKYKFMCGECGEGFNTSHVCKLL